MKTYSHLTIALMAIVAAQVQAGRGGTKAFSVSQSSNLGPADWDPESETSGDSEQTITYNSLVDVDTTVGWIDASKGEFLVPNKGVYRFTFTASVLCPPGQCTGDVTIVADEEVLANGHEVNANMDFAEFAFFVCSNITAE